MSKRDGEVVDVKDEKTAAGTALIAYPQKTEGTQNQLWGGTGRHDQSGSPRVF